MVDLAEKIQRGRREPHHQHISEQRWTAVVIPDLYKTTRIPAGKVKPAAEQLSNSEILASSSRPMKQPLGQRSRQLGQNKPAAAISGDGRQAATDAAWNGYTWEHHVPVWAVGGDHSMNTGPLEQFQNLAERVTGGVIENCGHWVAEEQPNRLLAELRAFLGEGR